MTPTSVETSLGPRSAKTAITRASSLDLGLCVATPVTTPTVPRRGRSGLFHARLMRSHEPTAERLVAHDHDNLGTPPRGSRRAQPTFASHQANEGVGRIGVRGLPTVLSVGLAEVTVGLALDGFHHGRPGIGSQPEAAGNHPLLVHPVAEGAQPDLSGVTLVGSTPAFQHQATGLVLEDGHRFARSGS